MNSIFDILSVTLIIAAVALYVIRRGHEHPPFVPYIVVALVAAVGNWLGNHGGGLAAIAFLISGAFLTLHLAGEPYRENREENAKARE